jgi:hypothetical protein
MISKPSRKIHNSQTACGHCAAIGGLGRRRTHWSPPILPLLAAKNSSIRVPLRARPGPLTRRDCSLFSPATSSIAFYKKNILHPLLVFRFPAVSSFNFFLLNAKNKLFLLTIVFCEVLCMPRFFQLFFSRFLSCTCRYFLQCSLIVISIYLRFHCS